MRTALKSAWLLFGFFLTTLVVFAYLIGFAVSRRSAWLVVPVFLLLGFLQLLSYLHPSLLPRSLRTWLMGDDSGEDL